MFSVHLRSSFHLPPSGPCGVYTCNFVHSPHSAMPSLSTGIPKWGQVCLVEDGTGGGDDGHLLTSELFDNRTMKQCRNHSRYTEHSVKKLSALRK